MPTSREFGSAGPAWFAAIISAAILVVTIVFHSFDQRALIQERLIEHRRQALFSALHVIDVVYANESFNNRPPAHPHPFDIQIARDADNKMRIYCKYPETVVDFRRAIGLHNPQIAHAPGVNLLALDEFRRQIARELDLPSPVGLDENEIWISNLDGAQ